MSPYKPILTFLVPGGVLFAFAFFFPFERIHHAIPETLNSLPHVIYTVGILLGWWFNRSRLVFAFLVMAIAHWALASYSLGRSSPGEAGLFVNHTVATFVPLNFALFSLWKERGVLTGPGTTRVAMILLQPLILYVLYQANPETTRHLFEFPRPRPTPWHAYTWLSPAAIISFGFGLTIVLVGYLRSKDPVLGGLYWAQMFILDALLSCGDLSKAAMLMNLGSVVLVLSLLETSYKLAFRDELTDVPSRRALNEGLMKLNGRYAIAMVDIDHFKKFNDRHGHEIGDQVLKKVAAVLTMVRNGGKVYRYGGEEFAILFPDRVVDDVIDDLDELRAQVAATPFIVRAPDRPAKKQPAGENTPRPKARPSPDKTLKVTISVGVAAPKDPSDAPTDVMGHADKALYRAKGAGRNVVKT